jgi:hypothetical protein
MTNSTNQKTEDPGRTPGMAEGVPPSEDQSEREPRQPGRTPSQAEGDLATVEEDIEEKLGDSKP